MSTHLGLLAGHGFSVVAALRGIAEGGLTREQMAPRWRNMGDEDFETRTAFLIAQRRPRLH